MAVTPRQLVWTEKSISKCFVLTRGCNHLTRDITVSDGAWWLSWCNDSVTPRRPHSSTICPLYLQAKKRQPNITLQQPRSHIRWLWLRRLELLLITAIDRPGVHVLDWQLLWCWSVQKVAENVSESRSWNDYVGFLIKSPISVQLILIRLKKMFTFEEQEPSKLWQLSVFFLTKQLINLQSLINYPVNCFGLTPDRPKWIILI